jgi:hypothetical protein
VSSSTPPRVGLFLPRNEDPRVHVEGCSAVPPLKRAVERSSPVGRTPAPAGLASASSLAGGREACRGRDSDSLAGCRIFCSMRTRASSKRKAEKLRSWRVSILRARAQYLGDVLAPDEKAAEAAAVTEFKLDQEQRRRLVVRERD